MIRGSRCMSMVPVLGPVISGLRNVIWLAFHDAEPSSRVSLS